MSDTYRFDPQLVQAMTDQLKGAQKQLRATSEQYRAGVAETFDWPGTVGDIAQQGRKNEQQERQYTINTTLAIEQMVNALIDATLGMIAMVKDTRDHNLEEIAKTGNRFDTDGFRGDSGTSGSGRRGG
ncbi:hypothetical protein [Streptomyces canus]|uniref:hypothetical protein n=1 Tax=Streptomyces canus TaxID=58343 RepID=UPI00037173EE|nr:hypothetical protein [Streptomyces canus]